MFLLKSKSKGTPESKSSKGSVSNGIGPSSVDVANTILETAFRFKIVLTRKMLYAATVELMTRERMFDGPLSETLVATSHGAAPKYLAEKFQTTDIVYLTDYIPSAGSKGSVVPHFRHNAEVVLGVLGAKPYKKLK